MTSNVIRLGFNRKDTHSLMDGRSYYNGCLAIITLSYLEALSICTDYLTVREHEELQSLRVEKRRHSFLLGRIAAKIALADFTKEENLKKYEIGRGVFLFPTVIGEDLSVSISHSGIYGAALVGNLEHPVSIDIEKVSDLQSYLHSVFENELELFGSLKLELNTKYTLLWSAREALGKVLKTGMTLPLEISSVRAINLLNNCIQVLFHNFIQYQVLVFCSDQHVLSLACPKNSVPEEEFLQKIRTALSITDMVGHSDLENPFGAL